MARSGTGVAGELARLSGFMLLGNLFQQLYYLTDVWMIGRYLGQDATAAVGAVMPVVNLLLTGLIGFAGGASVFFSQRFGAGDLPGQRRCVETAAVLWLAFSLLVTLAGTLLSGPAAAAMNIPAGLRGMARRYLVIVFAGTLCNSGYNTLAALCRGAGDAVRPMIFLALCALVNILLDLFFLLSLGLGVEGTALATILSQALAFAGLYGSLCRLGPLYRLRPSDLRGCPDAARSILSLGAPVALQQAASNLALCALQALVNSMEAQMIAGYTVALRIENFIVLPAVSLEHSVCSLVGRSVGGGQTDRRRQVLRCTLLFSALAGGVLFLLLGRWAGDLTALFLPSGPEAARLGGDYLRGVRVCYGFLLASYAVGGVFRGSGNTVVPLAAALTGSWLVRLPITWLMLRQGAGPEGLQLGTVLGWAVTLAVDLTALAWYLHKKRG